MTYFKAFTSYRESILPLSDAERGRLFWALLEYTETGKIPELSGNERFIFPTMKGQIDRDEKAYETKCERLSENAIKRHKKAADTDENMQLHANAGKDKDKDRVKEKKKNKEKDIITYTDTPTPAQTPSLEEIEEYCRVKKLCVNPKRFYDYYSKHNWRTSEGEVVDDWYSLAENWSRTEKDEKRAEGKRVSFDTDDFFEAAVRAARTQITV